MKIKRKYYVLKMLDGYHVLYRDKVIPAETVFDVMGFDSREEAEEAMEEMKKTVPYMKQFDILIEEDDED